MAFRLVADVLDFSPYEGTMKLVHVILASDASEGEGICWPSVARIARRAGVTPRRIQQIMAQMETDGIIERSQRSGHSNLLRVRYQAGVSPASSPPEASFTPTPEAGFTQNLLGESVTEPCAAERRERKADPLFEALAEVCGIDWQEGLTKTARGRLNKATAELREVGATPEDIRQRAKRYARRFPEVAITPQGLTGNWGLLQGNPPKASPEEQHHEIERVAISEEDRERNLQAVRDIAESLRNRDAAEG